VALQRPVGTEHDGVVGVEGQGARLAAEGEAGGRASDVAVAEVGDEADVGLPGADAGVLTAQGERGRVPADGGAVGPARGGAAGRGEAPVRRGAVAVQRVREAPGGDDVEAVGAAGDHVHRAAVAVRPGRRDHEVSGSVAVEVACGDVATGPVAWGVAVEPGALGLVEVGGAVVRQTARAEPAEALDVVGSDHGGEVRVAVDEPRGAGVVAGGVVTGDAYEELGEAVGVHVGHERHVLTEAGREGALDERGGDVHDPAADEPDGSARDHPDLVGVAADEQVVEAVSGEIVPGVEGQREAVRRAATDVHGVCREGA
jgi:hypothetical protein